VETTQVCLSLPPDSSTRIGLHPAFMKGRKFDKLLRARSTELPCRETGHWEVSCLTSYKNTSPGNNYRLIYKLRICLSSLLCSLSSLSSQVFSRNQLSFTLCYLVAILGSISQNTHSNQSQSAAHSITLHQNTQRKVH
jgi:hypothetical protein